MSKRTTNRARTGIAVLLGGVLLAAPVTAREFNIGGVYVDHPHAFVTEPGAESGVGALSLRNETDQTEALTEILGPFQTVTLRNKVEVGDEMRLVPVDRLAIPRGATITFSPDALHVFFDGLQGDAFEVGELIPTTFVFEKAGEMEVIFVVEEPGTDQSDH